MTKFDAIVIGPGQAGTPLAEKLTHEGQRAAIVGCNRLLKTSFGSDMKMNSYEVLR